MPQRDGGAAHTPDVDVQVWCATEGWVFPLFPKNLTPDVDVQVWCGQARPVLACALSCSFTKEGRGSA